MNDLKLWKRFLQSATSTEVHIGLITFLIPQSFWISDASESGLGGFISEGIAWRYKLPPYLVGKLTINLLEFMATAITINLPAADTAAGYNVMIIQSGAGAVTIAANGTGSITLVATPTGATQIAIVGARAIQRTSDFVTGGDFFANTLNDVLDQQTIFAQQNAEGLQRALQAP